MVQWTLPLLRSYRHSPSSFSLIDKSIDDPLSVEAMSKSGQKESWKYIRIRMWKNGFFHGKCKTYHTSEIKSNVTYFRGVLKFVELLVTLKRNGRRPSYRWTVLTGPQVRIGKWCWRWSWTWKLMNHNTSLKTLIVLTDCFKTLNDSSEFFFIIYEPGTLSFRFTTKLPRPVSCANCHIWRVDFPPPFLQHHDIVTSTILTIAFSAHSLTCMTSVPFLPSPNSALSSCLS